ncbi:MAG: type II toxin-antitoxin system HicB family antitoxin [Anaerolineae bacterium]
MVEEARAAVAMTEYVYHAMARARYQVLEDGSYYGDVFLCPGIWATGGSVEECRDALQEALAEWLVSAYEDREPTIDETDMAWLSLHLHRMGH